MLRHDCKHWKAQMTQKPVGGGLGCYESLDVSECVCVLWAFVLHRDFKQYTVLNNWSSTNDASLHYCIFTLPLSFFCVSYSSFFLLCPSDSLGHFDMFLGTSIHLPLPHRRQAGTKQPRGGLLKLQNLKEYDYRPRSSPEHNFFFVHVIVSCLSFFIHAALWWKSWIFWLIVWVYVGFSTVCYIERVKFLFLWALGAAAKLCQWKRMNDPTHVHRREHT